MLKINIVGNGEEEEEVETMLTQYKIIKFAWFKFVAKKFTWTPLLWQLFFFFPKQLKNIKT